MKYVEVQEQIVTQDLKASTASAAPTKWQTLDNIVNKTNVKLGGLNYAVHLEKRYIFCVFDGLCCSRLVCSLLFSCDGWLMREGRLVIGLDIAHPPIAVVRGKGRSGIPSVIGVSCSHDFVYCSFF